MSDENKTVVVATEVDDALKCVLALVQAVRAKKTAAAIFVEEFPLLEKALGEVGQLSSDVSTDVPGTVRAVANFSGELVVTFLSPVVPVAVSAAAVKPA